MDLTKVILVNYIDQTRISPENLSVSVQKLIRYTTPDGEDRKIVLSLTRRHWKIYDLLTGSYEVDPYHIMESVQKYLDVKDAYIDEATEICLDLIDQALDLDAASAPADKAAATQASRATETDGATPTTRTVH